MNGLGDAVGSGLGNLGSSIGGLFDSFGRAIGGLVGGATASVFGIAPPLLVVGAAILLFAAFFAWRALR
jgi:hypothetical protein